MNSFEDNNTLNTATYARMGHFDVLNVTLPVPSVDTFTTLYACTSGPTTKPVCCKQRSGSNTYLVEGSALCQGQTLIKSRAAHCVRVKLLSNRGQRTVSGSNSYQVEGSALCQGQTLIKSRAAHCVNVKLLSSRWQ